MAATGLLGINPYQKGVAVDISSKPINLAIQLEQKEQAKREALDKYFMDYEKSINPAGMRGQDQNVFLNSLGEAKQYYLQNNKEILNPAKYGADKQSEYMAKLKKAQSVIDQSKQAAANEKVDREHYFQAQKEGLDVPDGYLQDVERSHLPLNHPQYQPLDAYKYNFTKPFDEGAFSKTLTNGLTPSINKELSSEKPDNKGYINRTTTYEFNPLDKQQIKNRAELSYGHIPGVTNMTNKIIKSGEYLNYQKQFGELYPGQDITTAKPQQITAAVGLSITPHGKTINDQVRDEQYWINQHLKASKELKGYGKTPEEEPIHVFDAVGGGGREISKNYNNQPFYDGKNTYKIINGQVFDQNNKPVDKKLSFKDISGENFDKEFFDIINQHGGRATSNDLFNIETENGKIKIVKPENGANIDRKYAGELTNKFYKRKNVGKSNQEQVEIANF